MAKVGNGTLKLSLNPNSRNPLLRRQYFTVTGGRSKERPPNMPFVKMAAELNLPCDIDIPTHDFQTPPRKEMYRGLNKAVDLILAGEPLYVGCMGGIGRTGLFLAVLAKAFQHKTPVKYVRAGYLRGAVETEDQQAYIRKFAITPTLRRKITAARRAQARRPWRWFRKNLTNAPRMQKPALGEKANRVLDAAEPY